MKWIQKQGREVALSCSKEQINNGQKEEFVTKLENVLTTPEDMPDTPDISDATLREGYSMYSYLACCTEKLADPMAAVVLEFYTHLFTNAPTRKIITALVNNMKVESQETNPASGNLYRS